MRVPVTLVTDEFILDFEVQLLKDIFLSYRS